MSHYFGIEEIRTKLIVVIGLALSGEEFCKRYLHLNAALCVINGVHSKVAWVNEA